MRNAPSHSSESAQCRSHIGTMSSAKRALYFVHAAPQHHPGYRTPCQQLTPRSNAMAALRASTPTTLCHRAMLGSWPGASVGRRSGHRKGTRNADALGTTGTRAYVDSWIADRFVDAFGYGCDRPIDSGLVRQYSVQGNIVQERTSGERSRRHVPEGAASAAFGCARHHRPDKPGALSRVRGHPINSVSYLTT